jgi:hypothetical protein
MFHLSSSKKEYGHPNVTHLGIYTPSLTSLQATSTTPSTLVFPFYDVLDIGATPGAKSMSLFGGNPGISPKTSLKSLKTRWSKLLSILSLVASSIWDTKN